MEQKTVPASEDCGEMAWYSDGSILTTDEEIKEAIFEWKEWELGNRDHEDLFSNLDNWEKDEIMENNYRKVWTTTEETLCNCFLTERACREHIASNGYHYSCPTDFLTHAFRSYELEKVLQFLHEITNGKLHK
jgi:hypothetical protein